MRRTRVAFTLYECLLTLGLLLLVIGIGGDLMKRYSEQLRFVAAHDDAFSAVQVGLEQTAGDLRQCFNLTSPVVGTPASQLQYQLYDPGATWLPTTIPVPGQKKTDYPQQVPFSQLYSPPLPQTGGFSVSISASPAHQLVRTVRSVATGVSTQSVLASGVSAINASLSAESLLYVQLSLDGIPTQPNIATAVLVTLQ